MEVQGFDFNELSKEGIAAQKAQAEDEKRTEKAEKFVLVEAGRAEHIGDAARLLDY